MTTLRVVHLLASHVHSGAAPAVLRLAATQQQLGHELRIIRDGQRQPDELTEALEQLQLEELPLPGFSTKASPAAQLAAWRSLPNLLRSFNADLVHCHLSHDHVLAVSTRPFHRRPILRTLHSDRAAAPKPGRIWLRSQAAAVIARCQAHAVDGAHFIRPSIAPLPPHPAGSGPLPTGRRYVGTVGRFSPGRAQEQLLEAFAKLAPTFPNVDLVLAGRGERDAALRNHADELGIADRCHFPGHLGSGLPALLRQLEVFVLLREGNDLAAPALLEAMTLGLPVIGSDRLAIRDAIEADHSGLLVAPDDLTALQRAIETLLGDAALRKRLGQAAATRIDALYAPAREAEDTLALYREVLRA